MLAAGLAAGRFAWGVPLLNALFAAGLLAAARASERAAGASPWTRFRSRAASRWLPAALACACAAPTLTLPYFADDYGLLEHNEAIASPLVSMATSFDGWFFRPIPTLGWWVFARVAPFEPGLPRGVAIALLASAAALVTPALRRFGVRRDVAAAAALLFASSPVALETVVWLVNFYSLWALVFFLGALTRLPARIASRRSGAVLFALSLGAFLSKEDTFLLPVVAFAAVGRFRRRRAGRAIRAVAPILSALTIAVALRFVALGGFGGYRDPATGGSLLAFAPAAFLEAFRSDPFCGYFLPVRRDGASPASGVLWGLTLLLPIAALPLAGASRAGSRAVRAGLVVALLGVLPSLPMLPVGPGLATLRVLYVSAVGFAAILAAPVVHPRLGRAAKIAWMGLTLAVSVAAGQGNLSEWRHIAGQLHAAIRGAAPFLGAAKPGSRFAVLEVPTGRGVNALGAGKLVGLSRGVGRPDLTLLAGPVAIGAFQGFLWFDAQSGMLVGHTGSPGKPPFAVVKLSCGDRWTLDFHEASDRARCLVQGLRRASSTLTGAWTLEGASAAGLLALPVLDLPGNCAYTISLDGRASDRRGRALGLPAAVSVFHRDAFERQPLEVRAGRTPPGGLRARIEVQLFPGIPVVLNRIEVRLGG